MLTGMGRNGSKELVIHDSFVDLVEGVGPNDLMIFRETGDVIMRKCVKENADDDLDIA